MECEPAPLSDRPAGNIESMNFVEKIGGSFLGIKKKNKKNNGQQQKLDEFGKIICYFLISLLF